MKISDLLQETLGSLRANKSRSALTILGIVIGIASVITMISIGQGAAKSIESNIQSLGSNLLMIMPGAASKSGSTMVRGGLGSAQTLLLSDAEAIKTEIAGVDSVASVVSSRKQIKTTTGTNTNTSIYGVEESYSSVKNLEMEAGSFLNNIHNSKVSKVAVLGPTTRDDLFGAGVNPVGQKIRIDNIEFNIIGVVASKGGSGMTNSDDIVYVPLATAQRYFSGSDSVNTINVQVQTKEMMTFVQEEINSLLLTRHKITDAASADFSIVNQEDLMSAMTSVTDTLTLLLGAIAGISLLVGGIGIMNMMLTTVTERTREIGLRKSLGAKNSDISAQFLWEAVTLTFIGGVVGVLLGWSASLLVTKISGVATSVSTSAIFLACGVSAGIGIVFGFYPARRAAKLNPIEALRYE